MELVYCVREKAISNRHGAHDQKSDISSQIESASRYSGGVSDSLSLPPRRRTHAGTLSHRRTGLHQLRAQQSQIAHLQRSRTRTRSLATHAHTPTRKWNHERHNRARAHTQQSRLCACMPTTERQTLSEREIGMRVGWEPFSYDGRSLSHQGLRIGQGLAVRVGEEPGVVEMGKTGPDLPGSTRI
jgi:hypothetical protein